jgi:hypothetical protein
MKWTDLEIEIIKKEYPKGDLKELCNRLSRTLSAVSAKAERIGVYRGARINLAEKNGQWRGGINGDYYRRVAFDNLPNCCAICEATADLQVHHKDKNTTNNSIFNLMIVCNACHIHIHNKMRGWSKKYARCVVCGTKEKKHNAKGKCIQCYEKERYLPGVQPN